MLAFPATRSFNLTSEIRSDTRYQLANWIRENIPPGSKIFLDWKPYSPRFWENEYEVTYLIRSKLFEMLDYGYLKESGYDYLVLSSLFYDRYFTQPKSHPAARQHLRELFTRVPIVKEFAPKHGSYGFHNPTMTLFSLKKEDFDKLETELAMKKKGRA